MCVKISDTKSGNRYRAQYVLQKYENLALCRYSKYILFKKNRMFLSILEIYFFLFKKLYRAVIQKVKKIPSYFGHDFFFFFFFIPKKRSPKSFIKREHGDEGPYIHSFEACWTIKVQCKNPQAQKIARRWLLVTRSYSTS